MVRRPPPPAHGPGAFQTRPRSKNRLSGRSPTAVSKCPTRTSGEGLTKPVRTRCAGVSAPRPGSTPCHPCAPHAAPGRRPAPRPETLSRRQERSRDLARQRRPSVPAFALSPSPQKRGLGRCADPSLQMRTAGSGQLGCRSREAAGLGGTRRGPRSAPRQGLCRRRGPKRRPPTAVLLKPRAAGTPGVGLPRSAGASQTGRSPGEGAPYGFVRDPF